MPVRWKSRALRHGWVMPLGNRNVQTVLAEEMADAAQGAWLAAAGFDVDLLLHTAGPQPIWICRTSRGRVCIKFHRRCTERKATRHLP